MSKICRQDPKKRWKSEEFRKQARQKVFFDQREKRHSLVSKLRELNDVEKKELIATLLEDGLRTKEIENEMDASEEVPSYESIFIRNLDWEEFLCTEDYADLYNEIENALQSEVSNWEEESGDDNFCNNEYIPEDFTMDEETTEEDVLCPICRRRNLIQPGLSHFQCPGCSSFISSVTPDNTRRISIQELKQYLARSYDRYLQHRDNCYPSVSNNDSGVIFQINNNHQLLALCSKCGVMEPVVS